MTALTDTTGAVVERYGYDAYGNSTVLSADGLTELAAASQPYRTTGRRFDGETGLYYFRARYFDAGLGRFIGRDPLVSVVNFVKRLAPLSLGLGMAEPLDYRYYDGFSLYGTYFAVNFTDPSGLSCTVGDVVCRPVGATMGGGSAVPPDVIEDFANDVGAALDAITWAQLGVAGAAALGKSVKSAVSEAIQGATYADGGSVVSGAAQQLLNISTQAGFLGGVSMWVRLEKRTCECPPTEGQWSAPEGITIQVFFAGMQLSGFRDRHWVTGLASASSACTTGNDGSTRVNEY